VAIAFERGAWCLRDLKSANGLFVDGRRVESASVGGRLTVSLGLDGPSLTFEVEGTAPGTGRRSGEAAATVQSAGRETELLASYEERYFGGGAGSGQVGGRTMMIRRAFERVQRKQRRRYTWIVGVVAVAGLLAAGIALYKHRQMAEQQELALQLFYSIKALDVDIANMERTIAQTGTGEQKEQAQAYMARRRDMERAYDRFVAVLNLYDSNLSEEDRLILRVTRAFGECELAAPAEYMANVRSYIRKWQSSRRFEQAVRRAQERGYTTGIATEFLAHNLAPHFFYLALQESDFDAFTSGPPTYMGIAKGMWQFIPETGTRYGLKVGPLAKVRRPDPEDDRHDWQKATNAAARYIKDIYATDAQASGLLVMASYNWGENRVIRLLRSMPENPQERNFWKLLENHRHRVPKETYDYVFYIVSAAVIGENPRLFGIQLDSPLGFLDK
jgi:membrane-bound lytic murein transglycosylase D